MGQQSLLRPAVRCLSDSISVSSDLMGPLFDVCFLSSKLDRDVDCSSRFSGIASEALIHLLMKSMNGVYRVDLEAY